MDRHLSRDEGRFLTRQFQGRLGFVFCGVLAIFVASYGLSAAADDVATKEAEPGSTAKSKAEGSTSWAVIYMQGKRVGHIRSNSKPLTEDGQDLLQHDAEMVMKLSRFGQTVQTEMKIQSVADEDDNVRRFMTTMKAGPGVMKSEGVVEDGELKLDLSTLGKTRSEIIPWDGKVKGFFARDRSFEVDPMKPGDQRTIKMLVPMVSSPAEVELKAIGYETTDLLSGERKLLRIDSKTTISANGANTSMDETIYVDSAGVTMKSVIPAMQQITYRTTKEIALGDFDPEELDLGELSIVKVEVPADLNRRASARFRATFKSGDPSNSFKSGGAQKVSKLDDHSVEIAITPAAKSADENDPPTAGDRAANGMIQSDNAKIVEMAAKIAPQEKDPERLALAIERHVYDGIQKKDFTQVLATAAEVAENMQGDCTEHAVLLAALARARDLPARVSIGLVYARHLGGFGYHMWSEVWTGDRWLPLDGTLGRGGITPSHIKIAHSNLKGGGPFAAVMPVATVMGNLSLEFLE